MRVPRLISLTEQLISQVAHPQITHVETFDDPGTELKPCGIKITFNSGETVRLKIVGTSGPAGDDFTQPEVIPD